MVLLVLAGIWGVVIYGYVRERLAETRPADSIGSFRRQLSVLQRTGPVVHPTLRLASPVSPAAVRRRRGPSAAQMRRRNILSGLVASMGGSLLLGFIPPLRVMWGLHLVLDVAFVVYVVLLVRLRNVAAEREMKVRFLPSVPSIPSASSRSALPVASRAPEPALLLRRTGN